MTTQSGLPRPADSRRRPILVDTLPVGDGDVLRRRLWGVSRASAGVVGRARVVRALLALCAVRALSAAEAEAPLAAP
jgi:hypothetical protein